MKYILFFALFFAAGILSAQPAIQWQKCYGGTKNDVPGGMIQTRDSGYIMAGQTQSDDGDVTLNHGKNDLWVVKINSKGAIEWQKTYGGSNDDEGGVIMQTFDGGYLIAASTNSNDGDLQGIHASDTEFDVWVLKIDSVGKILWQKTYGGSGYDA